MQNKNALRGVFYWQKFYFELTNINKSMNKYTRWYNNITEKAKARTIDGYTEKHHIIPRSLGGSDNADNLVRLTAREHFVCHWLLTKMHLGEARGKMINALYLMQGKNKYQDRYINSKVYEKLRQEYSQYISNLNKGRIQPPEEKAKQITAITGRKRAPFSDEWRAKMSASKVGENNNRYGATVSNETKQKMREKALGRKQSAETIAKKIAATQGKKREKKLCPHCGQMIAVNTFTRWHGENCHQAATATK
jgi:5-methylcytosine-specific restriction endonuclease McrA